jgi:hypothetical protein
VLWFFFTLIGARPRSESSRRVQRGLQSAPLLWAPATCTVGHLVGVSVVIAPHVQPMHIPRVLQRHCGSAGGALDDLAPLHNSVTGTSSKSKYGRRGLLCNGGCCGPQNRGRCCRCSASEVRAPWPHAGNSITVGSDIGLDSVIIAMQRFRPRAELLDTEIKI